MAKVMSSGDGFPLVPPTDRELALRAQIKTGWSTFSKTSSHLQQQGELNQQEMRIIHEVVERAQAMDRMEEIRIGLLILKHRQMVENCRGDGVSTCRICNRDFTSHRSSRPEPIQYCQDCQMVICSRCKNVCRMLNGQNRVLCTVCHEERELWKKSGAWLDHSVPRVSIPDKELEEIQQQQVKTAKSKYTIGRKQESTPLMNPYHVEESDDEDDTVNACTSSNSHLQFNRSPDPSPILGRKVSPIPDISTPRAKLLDAAFSAKSSSDSEDQRSASAISSKTRSLSRKANLSRKGAITATERGRIQKTGDRVQSTSPARLSRSNSPPSMADRSTDATGNVLPSIKVSPIPSRHAHRVVPQGNRNSTPESEGDSPKKRLIHQIHASSSTESESIQVATKEPLPLQKSPTLSRSQGSNEMKTFIDEFKKVKAPPQKAPPVNESLKSVDDEFKKVKVGLLSRKSLPTETMDDEFKKVKISSLPRKSLPVEELGTHKTEDEFRKVKVSSPPSKPPPVIEVSENAAENEFKKVKSSAPPTKPPPVMDMSRVAESDFRKMRSSSTGSPKRTPEKQPKTKTLPRESESLVSSSSRASEAVQDEFKKVGSKASPSPQRVPVAAERSVPSHVTKPSSKPSPKPSPKKSAVTEISRDAGEETAGAEELFKKVSLPRTEQKPSVPTRRKVLPDVPAPSPPTVVPRSSSPSPSSSHPPLVTTASPSYGRVLRPLPSGSPAPSLPEKPVTSSASGLGAGTLVEAGKQGSITSVGSSVPSEYSAAFDVDSGMASPSSLGSSDSLETVGKNFMDRRQTNKDNETADGSHRGFDRQTNLTRRNASRHSKRPPPRPNLDGEEDKQQQAQGDEETGGLVRSRARSKVIRKRPQGMVGDVEDLQQSDNSHTLDEEAELRGGGSVGERQRRSRTRVTAVTAADRARARAASGKTDSEELASKPKADGSFGSVRMTLQYQESAALLNVTIHCCKGLRAMDSNGKSDPYVRLFLQPGNKMQRFQTKVIPKNLNPYFNEVFSFTNITVEAMQKKKLCVVVMDYDDFSKDDLIGATQVDLYQVLDASPPEVCIKRLLDDRSVLRSDTIVVDRGAIQLGLMYSTAKKGLVVRIIAASNIAGQKGECESQVKCFWTTKCLCMKGKTKVVGKTSCPKFNETLFFPASQRELVYATLTISLWERRSFKDKPLGEVHFKTQDFKGFSQNPTFTIEDWYPLEEPVVTKTSTPTHKAALKVSTLVP